MKAFGLSVSMFLLALLAVDEAQACSIQGYEVVKPHSVPSGKDFTPSPPEVSVKALERGYDDGNPGSCSDAGVLTIAIDNQPSPGIAGYVFRVTNGSFPDAVFPVAILAPVDIGDGERGFRFAWLDLPHEQRRIQKIDATIEVRLVSRNGTEGKPKLLHVLHLGSE